MLIPSDIINEVAMPYHKVLDELNKEFFESDKSDETRTIHWKKYQEVQQRLSDAVDKRISEYEKEVSNGKNFKGEGSTSPDAVSTQADNRS